MQKRLSCHEQSRVTIGRCNIYSRSFVLFGQIAFDFNLILRVLYYNQLVHIFTARVIFEQICYQFITCVFISVRPRPKGRRSMFVRYFGNPHSPKITCECPHGNSAYSHLSRVIILSRLLAQLLNFRVHNSLFDFNNKFYLQG